MPTIALLLEYDGSGFHGWQVQPGLRTIQGELHRALEIVLREKISSIEAAGRTDAGVHARGQVATFECSEKVDLFRLAHSVSSILRGELSVASAALVPDDFHPRRSSRLKHYRYTIFNRPTGPVLDQHRVWHVATPLDIERMRDNAAMLVGVHDFSSFRGAGCGARNPVRRIVRSEITVRPPYLEFTLVGEGFLKQMVRNLSGTLVGFGRNKIRRVDIRDILECRNRQAAGVTAPAAGLCLEHVEYERPIFGELSELHRDARPGGVSSDRSRSWK